MPEPIWERGPILYAHRGAPLERPENTIASFTRALELGAGAIETDAHLTSDGHVVLSHDPTGRRMANVAREIKKTPLAEVRRWDVGWGFVDGAGARPFAGADHRVPTLDEVLAAFPTTRFNVDAKQAIPSMVAPLLALLRKHGAERRVRIASFDGATLRAVRAAGWEGETGLAQPEAARLVAMPRRWLQLVPFAGHAAQVPTRFGPLSLGTRAFVEKCHAVGLRIEYWTIDDPLEARRLLALGADGIMTDDVARIAPVFRDLFG